MKALRYVLYAVLFLVFLDQAVNFVGLGSGFFQGRRVAPFDPPLFWFWGTPMPGQTPDTMEKALLEEMERLRNERVSDEELTRARNQTEAAFVFQEDSVHRRAALLARFELIGTYAGKDKFLERLRAVTPDDVQRVARAYFAEDTKNVGVLIPRP